jgi:hypothetical protein
MRVRSSLAVLGVCLRCTVAAALVGCSPIFVQGPPSTYQRGVVPECTTGHAAPVLDAVMVGFQAVRVGYAASQDDSDYVDFPISRGADIALGTGLSIAFLAFSAYGFTATSDCAKMQDQARHDAAASSAVVKSPAVVEGPPPPLRSPPPPSAECSYDAQCGAPNRICELNRCVELRSGS